MRPRRKAGSPIYETFRVDHTTDLARYFGTVSWTRADVASTQLRESGVVTNSGTIDTLRAGGGVTYDINRINSIAWTGQFSHTSYTNSTSTPYNDYATSLAWIRLLDPRTTWTTTLSFDWFDSSNIVSSQRLFWQIMTGVRSQLTRRLTVTASAGVAFVNGWNNGLAVALPATNTFQTGAATSWQALGTLNYQLLKTTNLLVYGGHLIVPTSDGHLQKTTTAGFGITHDVNAWSKVFFAANYAHTAANTNLLTSNADFFSATVGYSYRVSPRLAFAHRLHLPAARRQYWDGAIEHGAALTLLQFQPARPPLGLRPGRPGARAHPPAARRRRSFPDFQIKRARSNSLIIGSLLEAERRDRF